MATLTLRNGTTFRGGDALRTAVAVASAALTGTLADGATEAGIVTGGETLIITLTNDTWVASGGAFDAIRQDIIDGIAGTGGDTTDQLQNGLAVTDVVRTSDTVATITASAIGGYDIASTATYEHTIPGSALTGGSPIVATPTFNVTAVGGAVGPLIGGKLIGGGILAGRLVR